MHNISTSFFILENFLAANQTNSYHFFKSGYLVKFRKEDVFREQTDI